MAQPMDRAFSLDDVDDLDGLFARRQNAATKATEEGQPERGVAYGSLPGEQLNLFRPAPGTGAKAPVLVFIHGGFWKSLDADLFSFIAPAFAARGILVAVIDYPLMPAARMADVVASCRRSVAWLHANAEGLGGDPERIFVSGNSAGGHLVVELLDAPELAGKVAGGLAISGIYDLEPVTRSFQNDDLQLTAEEVAQFSPLQRELDLHAPLRVTVGGDETGEFLRQSSEMAQKVGAPSMVVPGTNHVTVLLDALAVEGHPLHGFLCEMIDAA
ncbi:alpha/beta hydrolase [Tropicimonas sp. IMCC34011]|uniref:alpha/beta hydrolase n=1 Tax=Tropicimonas sp. IMCC34011 TaxID=2248759 RepID=UPI000E26D464|nr:alpha/beta hydrolase [Tropicimonas sp. IMCC34011]